MDAVRATGRALGWPSSREEWMCLRRESPDGRLLVDLSDVTFIDEAGEELLREMRDRGVEFVAKGVETRHILEKSRYSREAAASQIPPGLLNMGAVHVACRSSACAFLHRGQQ